MNVSRSVCVQVRSYLVCTVTCCVQQGLAACVQCGWPAEWVCVCVVVNIAISSHSSSKTGRSQESVCDI